VFDVGSDAITVVTLDGVTSIFAGFAVFSTLGHLAHTLDTSVDKVATSGRYTVCQSRFIGCLSFEALQCRKFVVYDTHVMHGLRCLICRSTPWAVRNVP